MDSKPVQKIGVVIPIYNPDEAFLTVLIALAHQTYPISRLIVIDSSPDKGENNKLIKDYCRCAESVYLPILPEEFDHGKTRNLGVTKTTDLDAVLFLTQDAIMSKECLENLVGFLNLNSLAGVFARQLPREKATGLEVIERKLTYPPVSWVREGLPRTIEDSFSSDVCSLMRIDAFLAVGGFPNKIIASEDMVITNKMLRAGYKTGYCAAATLKHSHKLSFTDTFKRYFSIGVMHEEWKNEISINSARGKGARLVITEFGLVIRNKPTDLPSLISSVLGKIAGYYLGRRYLLLSPKLRSKFSQNKAYWIT